MTPARTPDRQQRPAGPATAFPATSTQVLEDGSDGTLTLVARGFGYQITHVVTVPRTTLQPMAWPGPRHPFTGIQTPVIASCGRCVRSCQPALVIMKPGTAVRCRSCARLTGIQRQPETASNLS